MKFKVLFILTGVIILHAIILTGVSLTGGCNSAPVLGPRPFLPAPATQDDAIEYNKIPDTKETMPGVTIKTQTITPPAMPSPPTFELTPPQGIIYTVKKNDSFWKIARKHGVTMQNLAAYNNMPLNKILRVGQKLKIPPGGYIPKEVPKEVKIVSPVKSKPLLRPSDGVYTVKSGDSFWKIAKKYNLKTKTLLDANNMTGKETLQIGQKLIIPDGKKSILATASVETATINNSAKSILDTVDNPDDTKIDDKETAPNAVKELIEDNSIDDSDDGDRAVQIPKDIKVADFAKQYKITPAMLEKLNDDYPSDGVFKAGSVVIVRSAE
ncbi:MAG: LysM peptidoglycan-binding domain-containing protein [Victivallaceae bacterium]|nr:LysM peptidoglycan-binding domain-containing protein [Victivallaceae bacterium]